MYTSSQSLTAPFRVLADFREAKAGWRFKNIADPSQPGQTWTVPLDYRLLGISDYVLNGLPLHFVRRTATDVLASLRHWPQHLVEEQQQLRELEESGASCLVIIEGEPPSILELIDSDFNTDFSREGRIQYAFAENRSAAESLAFMVMRRAWLREFGSLND